MDFRCQVWGFSTNFWSKLGTSRYRFLFAKHECRSYRRFIHLSSWEYNFQGEVFLWSQTALCKVHLWVCTTSLHWILHEKKSLQTITRQTVWLPTGAIILLWFPRIPAFVRYSIRKRANPDSKCCENAFHISSSGRHSWVVFPFSNPMRLHLTTRILNFRCYWHKFSLMSSRNSNFQRDSFESFCVIPSRGVEWELYCVTKLAWTMHPY